MQLTPVANTGYSGFWNEQPGNAAGAPYNPAYGRSSQERRLSIILARPGFRIGRAVMRALNGAAPGAPWTTTTYGIEAAAPFTRDLGGVRNIVPSVRSGNTTAGQRDQINAEVYDAVFNQAPATYPRDASGNGGGGKLGY